MDEYGLAALSLATARVQRVSAFHSRIDNTELAEGVHVDSRVRLDECDDNLLLRELSCQPR